MLYTNT